MTIKKIRDNLFKSINKKVRIIYNGSRNKREEFNGVISEVYNYIFIVRLDTDEVKSFSYSDVLTGVVEIFFDKI